MLPAPRSPDGRTLREDQPILAGHGGTNSIIPVTNPLERLNKEIKRRADVVGIFANDAAVVRLVGALMLEQSDEWAVSRRYFSLESLASLADTDALKLPAVAA